MRAIASVTSYSFLTKSAKLKLLNWFEWNRDSYSFLTKSAKLKQKSRVISLC